MGRLYTEKTVVMVLITGILMELSMNIRIRTIGIRTVKDMIRREWSPLHESGKGRFLSEK